MNAHVGNSGQFRLGQSDGVAAGGGCILIILQKLILSIILLKHVNETPTICKAKNG